jgi:hypothetical protein
MEIENQARQFRMLEMTVENQALEMQNLREAARSVPAPSTMRPFGPGATPPIPMPPSRINSSSMYGGRLTLSALPPRIPVSAGPSRMYCLNCEGIGHTKATCPHLKQDHRLVGIVTCDVCGQPGHIAGYCPNVNH